MIKNYLPKKAVKLILEGAILIDVRCEAENKFVGRVPVSYTHLTLPTNREV